jgi:hypothetical protein
LGGGGGRLGCCGGVGGGMVLGLGVMMMMSKGADGEEGVSEDRGCMNEVWCSDWA